MAPCEHPFDPQTDDLNSILQGAPRWIPVACTKSAGKATGRRMTHGSRLVTCSQRRTQSRNLRCATHSVLQDCSKGPAACMDPGLREALSMRRVLYSARRCRLKTGARARNGKQRSYMLQAPSKRLTLGHPAYPAPSKFRWSVQYRGVWVIQASLATLIINGSN